MGIYGIYYWVIMGITMILLLLVPKGGSVLMNFVIYIIILGSGMAIAIFPIWAYSTYRSHKYRREFHRKWGLGGIDAKGRPQR